MPFRIDPPDTELAAAQVKETKETTTNVSNLKPPASKRYAQRGTTSSKTNTGK
jgi:hypothetical protein